jgi:hypothetical protein
VLTNKDKLFNKYISIPSNQHLKNIIACFKDLTSIPHICGAIDGTHIPLVDFPSKKVTLIVGDFFNRKKFYNIMLQVLCDVDKIFWNIFVGQPRRLHDGGEFKRYNLYAQLRSREIFQESIIIIQGMKCTPFLINDVILSNLYLLAKELRDF